MAGKASRAVSIWRTWPAILTSLAEQLRRGLSALHQAGKLGYAAPFRGRGLRVLQRVPVTRLEVNYSAVERRGQFERRQLRKMVDYAYSRSCLRRFILEYFGESVSHSAVRKLFKLQNGFEQWNGQTAE